MKTVYEAANAVEAHMLVDLLKQEGIEAHIHGEALQGAVGEIPANGLVRLVVREDSFAAARAAVERWEGTQVEPTPRPQRSSGSAGLRGLLLGLVVGVGATYAAYRAPVTTDGIDHDKDGVLDEHTTFSPNGMPIKWEVDRNRDHKIDYVAHYDARGQIDSVESDDNFDGVFETRQWQKNGNIEVVETDTDGDGLPDLRSRYVHGVVDTTEYLDRTTGQPVRIEHYVLAAMTFADVDTDGDGKLDTRVRYTKLAEVAAREPLPK